MYVKKNGTPDHSPMKLSPAITRQGFKSPLDFEQFNVESDNVMGVIEQEKRNRPRDLKDILGILDPRQTYQ